MSDRAQERPSERVRQRAIAIARKTSPRRRYRGHRPATAARARNQEPPAPLGRPLAGIAGTGRRHGGREAARAMPGPFTRCVSHAVGATRRSTTRCEHPVRRICLPYTRQCAKIIHFIDINIYISFFIINLFVLVFCFHAFRIVRFFVIF